MRVSNITTKAVSLSDTDLVQSLEQVCGFGGFPSGLPNQWFRFFLPIFLHGGVLHLVVNMFVYQQSGWALEKMYGSLPVASVLLVAGLAGNVLGGVFGPLTLISVGASGAIFGIIGMELMDLLRRWKQLVQPKRQLIIFLIIIAIMIAFSFLPFVDYWAHIGGLIFGSLAAIAVMPPPESPVSGDSSWRGVGRRLGGDRVFLTWVTARVVSFLLCAIGLLTLIIMFYRVSR